MLGVLKSDDLNKELNKLGIDPTLVPRVPEVEVVEIKRGRTKGKAATPNKVREAIAAEAICGASIPQLQAEYDISPSSISAYKNGATSTASYNKPSTELADANNQLREKVTGVAQVKLMQALGAIEFTGDIKPQVASAVARDMSGIIKNLQPDAGVVVNNKVLIYKPRMKDEDDYEVLEVVE